MPSDAYGQRYEVMPDGDYYILARVDAAGGGDEVYLVDRVPYGWESGAFLEATRFPTLAAAQCAQVRNLATDWRIRHYQIERA